MATTPLGAVITDAATGFTLYVFQSDQPGQSTCTADCLLQHPPFAAPIGTTGSGDWTIVPRGDAIPQWAYRGRPLYFGSQDQQPGDTQGQSADGAWQAARP